MVWARGAECRRELRRWAREMGGDKARALDAMLWAVRTGGGGGAEARGGGGADSASAFLIPKNEVGLARSYR